MLFEQPIGLALSGGGAKGLAHAGVLQFLEEKNIKIKKIAGTSSGAIVGGLYAAGKSPEEILGFFKSVNLFHWKHFTIVKPGIIDAKAFRVYFNNFIENILIGEAKTDVLITATDLVSGRLKVFKKDENLIDAMLCSSSVPGVFSPYKIEDNLYTDGGVLNNFPTDLLQADCEHIVGVYVNPLQDIVEKDINSIRAVTSRAFELLAVKEMFLKSKICTTLIEPKALNKFGTFDNNKQKMDAIFEIGYNEAKKIISPIL